MSPCPNPLLSIESPPFGQLHRRSASIQGQGSRGELLRLLGAGDAQAGAAAGEPLAEAEVWCVRAGAALLHEGGLGDTVYLVRSGSLKCMKTLEDGYEQVFAFAQPGDLLGYEALHGGTHPATVVALEHSTVYALPLAQLRGGLPWLDEGLRQGLSRQLARAAETAELMSAVTADVRLARFILWMSARMARMGQSPRRFHLRMGRRDIASFLGTAHETTSRSFTTLAELGLIAVDNREIEILDLDGLKIRAMATRGASTSVDGAGRAQPARRLRDNVRIKGDTRPALRWLNAAAVQGASIASGALPAAFRPSAAPVL
jgi:CRP/FNR family transcriptional regulator, anaerobic regulatory protein